MLGYREGAWTSSQRGLNLCAALDILSVTDAGEAYAIYCNGSDGDRNYSLTCIRLAGRIKDGKLTIYPYDSRPFTYELRTDGSLSGAFSSQGGTPRTATLTRR